MKAVVLTHRNGGLDAVELVEEPVPVPQPGEVLVRIHAASINDWDWGLVQEASAMERLFGRLVSPKVRILGCDMAGSVVATGAAVEAFRPGDAVYGDLCASGFGAFAEYACVPAANLAPMPAGMSFEQAAAIPQAGMLAVQGLVDAGRIGPGCSLLLNGAGGGVGTFALQIARLHAADVTAVDKGAKLGMLSAMGAGRVIDYTREDFTEGEGRYDLVLDLKTTRPPWAYTRVLNPGGRYVCLGGSMTGLLQAAVFGPLVGRRANKCIRIVMLKPNKDLAYLNRLFDARQLQPVIEGPFALKDVHAALRLFSLGDHQGKIVLRIA